MRTMKLIGPAVIVLGVFLGLNAGRVLAQEHGHEDQAEKSGHSHDRATLHGGSVTMTQQHHFEVIFHEKELRIYVYTGAQDPIFDLKGISGSVMFRSKGGDTLTVKLSYDAPDSSHESTQGYLSVKHDFSGVKEGTMKASISLEGLSNPKETSVTFRESVRLQVEDSHEKEKEHEEHGEHDQGGHDEEEGDHDEEEGHHEKEGHDH